MKNKKIVMITSLQPYSNYSSYLTREISNQLKEAELIVYSENNDKNDVYREYFDVRKVWDKGSSVFCKLTKELIKDKPDLIHLQYELNMYGGMLVAGIMPLYLIFLRLFFKSKVLITLHAVVSKKIIDKKFVSMFKGDSKLPPCLLKLFFSYLNFVLNAFSDQIIVHTDLLKNILVEEYNADEDKIVVVRHGVPMQFSKRDLSKEKYFFYFGYIAKRKGLENLLEGYKKYIDKYKDGGYRLLLGGGVIKGQEFALEDFKKTVKDLKIGNKVEFLGFLEKEQMLKYFTDAYCVTIPAAISISASGPLAQSFGYGKCVIVSDIGNFSEEINHKKDGLLTNNDNWGNVFIFAHENEKEIIDIEKNVVTKAINRSWSEVSKKHINYYLDLMSSK